VEVSLVIGIVACGSSACPSPSTDLGEILFIGTYQSQGQIGKTLNLFENFTFGVPSDISGRASIQVQHVFFLTPPVSVLQIFGSGCLFGVLRRDTRSLVLSTPASALMSLQALRVARLAWLWEVAMPSSDYSIRAVAMPSSGYSIRAVAMPSSGYSMRAVAVSTFTQMAITQAYL
jgi:hypothetical protein